MNRTVAVFACLCLLSLLLACGSVDLGGTAPPGTQPKTSQRSAAAPRLTVGDFYTEFRENELAAELKYKGKPVELTNVPPKTAKDETDKFYLAIEGGRIDLRSKRTYPPGPVSPQEIQRRLQESVSSARYLPGVIMYIDPKAAADFAALKPDAKPVTLRGVCRGTKKDANSEPDWFVLVEECVLVPPEKKTPRKPGQ